jgi:hypothetical protein
MLDGDLAMLYGVPTKALNQAFRRTSSASPDFVFQLTRREFEVMRSQIVTTSRETRVMVQFENVEQRFCLAPTALFIVSLGQRPRNWIALFGQMPFE